MQWGGSSAGRSAVGIAVCVPHAVQLVWSSVGSSAVGRVKCEAQCSGEGRV